MASSSLEEIELGFAEKPDDPKRLTSPYFPSKIGGRPAWLVPNLPTPEDLVCKKCNKPRVFLLQVYAPIDHLTHCYHRTLYIFCCREPSCHSRNFTEPFLVLRCNLSQVNSFYDGQPTELVDEGTDKDVSDIDKSNTTNSESDIVLTAHPSIQDNSVTGATTNSLRCSNNASSRDDGDDRLVEDRQQTLESNCNLPPLCIVCGCSGPKRCAKCHSMSYCSREHQVIHWKAGHKKYCGDETQSTTTVADGILFDEFEIVTEPETPIKIVPKKTEEERLKDYQNYLEQHSGKFDPAKMDKMCFDDVEKEVKKDKQFMTFKKRIKVEPDQVWTYCMFLLKVLANLQ